MADTDRTAIVRQAGAELARGYDPLAVIHRWKLCETEYQQARVWCINHMDTMGIAQKRAEHDDRRNSSRSEHGGY